MFCCDTSTLASGSWLCRDLGTTLSHLQVLWISHYSLADLDGVPSSSLKELYVAYNRVSDLSQVSMLENLQLLDLEGNDVDDLVQVQYLGLCSQLRTLTVEGNPVFRGGGGLLLPVGGKGAGPTAALPRLHVCRGEGRAWLHQLHGGRLGPAQRVHQRLQLHRDGTGCVCVCLFASIRPLILLCVVLFYIFPLPCLAIEEKAAR
ncbi:leucine-rich repeat-containing protein 56-like isoform X1 [Salmo trutta]|uniref:leucine-rich repeat-containing protein 56-like isoform X1 n=1 Tax=Salmo trutta TaxID=8032 RepID=UPI0011325888|nr:leucine-rich repeat-containing protein 56-like isoform X1 [Salmo trutta]